MEKTFLFFWMTIFFVLFFWIERKNKETKVGQEKRQKWNELWLACFLSCCSDWTLLCFLLSWTCFQPIQMPRRMPHRNAGIAFFHVGTLPILACVCLFLFDYYWKLKTFHLFCTFLLFSFQIVKPKIFEQTRKSWKDSKTRIRSKTNMEKAETTTKTTTVLANKSSRKRKIKKENQAKMMKSNTMGKK